MTLAFRALVLAALALAGIAPAAAFDIKPLLEQPRGWIVEGKGRVTTLPQLGAVLTAAPSSNVRQLGDYNAARDGTFAGPVIAVTYTGAYNGRNRRIDNFNLVNLTDTVVWDGMFTQIGIAGSVKNLTISGTVVSAGANTGLLFGVDSGLVENVTSIHNVTNITPAKRGGGMGGFIDVNGTVRGVNCYGYAEVQGNNQYLGGCIGYTWGLIENSYSAVTTYTGPGTITGAWHGCMTAAVGNISGTQSTAIIRNSWCSGAVNCVNIVNAGNYCGGLAGIVYDGQVINSYATGPVTGASYVGGLAGRVTSTAIIQRSYSTSTITAGSNKVGGFVGQNEGAISFSWASGNVAGVGAVGGFIGTQLATGSVDHAFALGAAISNGSPGAGGFFGQNVGGGVATQIYSIGLSYAPSTFGGFIGYDANSGVTLAYWNTTVSGLTKGSGQVTTPATITGLTDTALKAALPSGFDGNWTRNAAVLGGLPTLAGMVAPANPPPAPQIPIQIILTATGTNTWTVPANWNSTVNTVEAIGEGGNGANATTASAGRGGGGGAYVSVKALSFTPGASVSYTIGAGGTSTKTQFKDASTLVADFGLTGTTAATGTGGTAAASIGASPKYGGGNGGVNTNNCSGGGGGAAGNFTGTGRGAGGAGGTSTNCAGGGGGGAGLNATATNGTAGTSTGGGLGGTSWDGTAGGAGSTSTATPGAAGFSGSGGGGGYASTSQSSVGGKGGDGLEYTTAGSGGGGGGGGGESVTLPTGAAGGAGGNYGAGGGGGGRGTTTPGLGGLGAPGVIIVTYTP